MGSMRAVIRRSTRKLRMRRAVAEATSLLAHPNPQVRAIALAILATLKATPYTSDAAVLAGIEARRTSLLQDETVVEVVDFGAGSRS